MFSLSSFLESRNCVLHLRTMLDLQRIQEKFNKLRLDALSIPKYVIKKGKTSDIDDNGRIIRSPDALRPLTLCNCDCKLLTSAICRGLLWYTKRCIHPSQRCISSRQMTDNIFEIETTALPHVACAPQGSGVLLTDFAAAYPSVNHSWIFSVLENTGLPGFLCHFLRSIYKDSICGSRPRTIPYDQRCATRLSCEWFPFCNGIWPDLPMAPRNYYPKEPRQLGFLATCTMRLRWWPRRCFILIWRVAVRTGTGVSFYRLHCWPQLELS